MILSILVDFDFRNVVGEADERCNVRLKAATSRSYLSLGGSVAQRGASQSECTQKPEAEISSAFPGQNPSKLSQPRKQPHLYLTN